MPIFLSILFILVCVLLIGIVLLQKGRGGGLSGAFGGAGGHSAFGSRTGDMFTWITVVLVGLFLTVATAAVKVFKPAQAQQETVQPAPADGEEAPATMPADDATATDEGDGEEAPAPTPADADQAPADEGEGDGAKPPAGEGE